ncbi:alkaline shock response membrane anchor protein AmaP [Secundilactobacillus malefermentans]|uniref:alkaline shock response membrane anchor protein AmaP n=1 Tax=Secundilactobacillus malefermentans TaxID=176292 RepID=UPI0011CB43D9|nr:alkaline shock response membrane anchor protein AmaP [Secundilactobacillus malefermentans]QEA31775.1 alkaline shock response membrane anchor protein AmaP [Secundilactobacillus malefermentans]
MCPILKLGLALVSIIGILQAIWFALLVEPTNRWTSQLVSWQADQPWLSWVGVTFSIVAALICIALLFYATFKRSTTSQLQVRGERGKLTINKQAVEKTVKHAVLEKHSVSTVAVNVKLRKTQEAATAKVKATMTQPQTDWAGESRAIEKTAKAALEHCLGVDVKKVNVALTPASRDQKTANVI